LNCDDLACEGRGTADRILRMTTPWTLDPAREQTVLLPFDFSAPATAAIHTALGLVARPELLWVHHVVPPVSTMSPGFVLGDVTPAELRRRAHAALEEALAAAGIRGVQPRVTIGDPADEILLAVTELDADLIVMPSCGKTGLRRWMLGSVAEKVVRRATCPVLILPVRAEQADDQDEELRSV
jgi:nucleotide-binding universal stress UspA family protein